MVLNAARNNANANGHRKCFKNLLKSIYDTDFLPLAVEMCLACCAECFVGIIESLVAYFNRYACFAQLSLVATHECIRRYAYIEIALYGKPYIRSAKDTWRLFKDRGERRLNKLYIAIGKR